MVNKILVVCGPTSSGKTSLGVCLAQKFDGEILSADSRQVYRGMDIGTGKDINKQISRFQIKRSISNDEFQVGYHTINGVKVWLLDVVDPGQNFSVAQYAKLGRLVIKNIWQRNKLPIVVGGSGFYIKGLIDGIESLGIGPDWELRKKMENKKIETIRKMLEKVSPERSWQMNESDRRNKRRLIRAIEIAKKNKDGKLQNTKPDSSFKNADTLFVGLKAPYGFLYKRIDRRVDDRIDQGMIDEVRGLIKGGVDFQRLFWFGMEYRVVGEYLQGVLTRKEMIRKLKYKIHAYARRQMTWFRRGKNINWFDIQSRGWKEEVEKIVGDWYTKKDAGYKKQQSANPSD